jgi:integrase
MKHGSVYQRHILACPRAEGGGYAAHRCRGPWSYLIDLGPDANGKRVKRGKGGFPNKAAAREALREALDGLVVGVSTLHDLTVSEYLDSWLAGKHALKPKTVAGYKDAINLYLRPGLGHIRLRELRAEHLDRFYESIRIGRRGRPLSPSSIRRVHATLRSALNSAVKRRLIPYNSALHVELAPENPKRPQPWTAEECRTFLRRSAEDRLITMYHLMIVTGLRRGEALGLRWSDVDLERSHLVVRQQITEVHGRAIVGKPKTKRSQRNVALDAAVAAALLEHRGRQQRERATWGRPTSPDDLVFTREDGKPVRPEFATRHFQALSKKAKLREIRLHDLRHTSASLALAAGIEMKVVSERLGHSALAITADLYTHVVPQVARDAADRLGAALGVGTSTSAYEAPTAGGQPPLIGPYLTEDSPTTNKAPDRVSAGQGPAP